MAKIRTMTEGHPLKLIFAFSLPLMFGNVFQQFYTVVDTMVVGQALGVGALAALGAADWLNWMVLGMIQGISQGFAILMAFEFGAGDYKNYGRSSPIQRFWPVSDRWPCFCSCRRRRGRLCCCYIRPMKLSGRVFCI